MVRSGGGDRLGPFGRANLWQSLPLDFAGTHAGKGCRVDRPADCARFGPGPAGLFCPAGGRGQRGRTGLRPGGHGGVFQRLGLPPPGGRAAAAAGGQPRSRAPGHRPTPAYGLERLHPDRSQLHQRRHDRGVRRPAGKPLGCARSLPSRFRLFPGPAIPGWLRWISSTMPFPTWAAKKTRWSGNRAKCWGPSRPIGSSRPILLSQPTPTGWRSATGTWCACRSSWAIKPPRSRPPRPCAITGATNQRQPALYSQPGDRGARRTRPSPAAPGPLAQAAA